MPEFRSPSPHLRRSSAQRSKLAGRCIEIPDAADRALQRMRPRSANAIMSPLEARALRYWTLHASPIIGARTVFFAAAARVTDALSCVSLTQFMHGLGERLEQVNQARADAILAGRLYRSGSIDSNTVDFIRVEQELVERQLQTLRMASAERYRREIACANNALHSLASSVACFGPPKIHPLRAVILGLRERNGELPDFASQAHRETIGRALAFGSVR